MKTMPPLATNQIKIIKKFNLTTGRSTFAAATWQKLGRPRTFHIKLTAYSLQTTRVISVKTTVAMMTDVIVMLRNILGLQHHALPIQKKSMSQLRILEQYSVQSANFTTHTLVQSRRLLIC
jgi:hypothetical protein